MSNKLNAAANAVKKGDIDAAVEQLLSLHEKLDGNPAPKDWMVESEEKNVLRDEIDLLIELLLLW